VRAVVNAVMNLRVLMPLSWLVSCLVRWYVGLLRNFVPCSVRLILLQ
jgi:Na+-transporting NADH:ubiquinone oxidoreductase subunit NqrD